jgi:hypothetical protein
LGESLGVDREEQAQIGHCVRGCGVHGDFCLGGGANSIFFSGEE